METMISISDNLYVPAQRFGFRSQYRVGLQGKAWKRGHYVKNWKRRYMFLKNNVLKYFADEKMALLKGTFVIDDGCTVSAGKDGWEGKVNIVVINNSETEFYISADSKADQDRWIEAIQDTINNGLPFILQPELCWPKFQIQCVVDVLYDNGVVVQDGNLVKPAQMRLPPSVFLTFKTTPDIDDRYLLLSFDVDYPSRKSPKHCHALLYMLANIRPQGVGGRSRADGDTPAPRRPSSVMLSASGGEVVYHQPPRPALGSGLHRIFFVVLKQSTSLSGREAYVQSLLESRWPFSMKQCIEELRLEQPVGVDGCYTEWDSSCAEPLPPPPPPLPLPPAEPEGHENEADCKLPPGRPPYASPSPDLSLDDETPTMWSPTPHLRHKTLSSESEEISPAPPSQPQSQSAIVRAAEAPEESPVRRRHNRALPSLAPEGDDDEVTGALQETAGVLSPKSAARVEQLMEMQMQMHLGMDEAHLLPGHPSMDGIVDFSSRSSSVTFAQVESKPSRVSFSSMVMVSSPDGTPSAASSPDRGSMGGRQQSIPLMSALKGHRPSTNKMRRKSVSFKTEQEERLIDSVSSVVERDILDYEFEGGPDYSLDYDVGSGGGRAAVPMRPIIRADKHRADPAAVSPVSPALPTGHTGEHVRQALPRRPGHDAPAEIHTRGSVSFSAMSDLTSSFMSPRASSESGAERSLPSVPEAAAASEPDPVPVSASWSQRVELLHAAFLADAPVLLPGGLLKKKFGTDFTFKDSFVWVELGSLSLHWAKSAGDRGAESKHKHVRFPVPARAAQHWAAPLGTNKGLVKAVIREDHTVTLVLEPLQTLKLKMNSEEQARRYQSAFQRLLDERTAP